jgi:hypothetical protein
MGFALSALGAAAESTRLRRGAVTGRYCSTATALTVTAGSLPTASATSLTTTAAAAALFFSIHEVDLPAFNGVAVIRMAPPPPASGHHEDFFRQASFYPGLNNRFRVAGHEGDHLDTVTGNHRPHRARNRAANQCFNAQLNQLKRSLHREFAGQDMLFLADHASPEHFHQADVPGDVENRGNAMIPDRYGDVHEKRPSVLFDPDLKHRLCRKWQITNKRYK